MKDKANQLVVIGAATIVAAVVFFIIAPAAATWIFHVNSPENQGILVTIELVVSFIAKILPPFGAAILAAGLVLKYSTKSSN